MVTLRDEMRDKKRKEKEEVKLKAEKSKMLN